MSLVKTFDPSRRTLLTWGAGLALSAGLPAAQTAHAQSRPGTWISTTQTQPWQDLSAQMHLSDGVVYDGTGAFVDPAMTYQTIDGFGGCFNELGARAFTALTPELRHAVARELFEPGTGGNLIRCRLPIGASDYALDWYSYDETPGDFDMTSFSIERDRHGLIPYIRAAQAFQPDMAFWASPWSPPTWMKTNKHYAMRPSYPGAPANNLAPGQEGREGQDMFIQDARYFKAYALYFRKYVEAYRAQGICISAVMPQNEFNSAQPFPSCCWTPEGLARFIPYLGAEMTPLNVDVFFGTLERGDAELFERVYADPDARKYIKGIGAQWAGKGAIPFIHHAHPELKVYQSEQECGDGKNDWRYARYTWSLMKLYFKAGASVYDYWNIVNPQGGVSHWGWAQNSFVSVDEVKGTYSFTPDYYVFKHLSHFVRPGAKRIEAASYTGYDNMLAFQNADGRIIVAMQNDLSSDLPVQAVIGGRTLTATLPADSFNTFAI